MLCKFCVLCICGVVGVDGCGIVCVSDVGCDSWIWFEFFLVGRESERNVGLEWNGI